MPKSNKRRSPKTSSGAVRAFGSRESRAAEFMTIGWLLTTFTTLVCELGSVAATWYANYHPEAQGIAVLAGVLMFAALATGVFSLLLLAAVWKLRTTQPPQGITLFAVFVAAAPIAILLIRRLMA